LDLGAFAPGALFRIGGRFYAVTDPRRAPRHLLSTLLAPIGTLKDRLLMAKLARRLLRGGSRAVFSAPVGLLRTFCEAKAFRNG
jgi:hypothetical protein